MGIEEAARKLAVFWAIETWNQTFRLAISSDYFDRAGAFIDSPEAAAVPAARTTRGLGPVVYVHLGVG